MTHFRLNPALEKELGPEVRARVLIPAAHSAADRAEGFVHSAMPRPGRRRIEVDDIGGEVAIVNTNHGAHLEEWGLAFTPMYAPLRRGARAAGLDLHES
jgi:hypothetical protein